MNYKQKGISEIQDYNETLNCSLSVSSSAVSSNSALLPVLLQSLSLGAAFKHRHYVNMFHKHSDSTQIHSEQHRLLSLHCVLQLSHILHKPMKAVTLNTLQNLKYKQREKLVYAYSRKSTHFVLWLSQN